MFTGQIISYLDVRTFVEADYGNLDESSEVFFLTALGNALRQMWVNLRESPLYFEELALTPSEEGVIELPANLAKVCAVVGTTDGVETTFSLHEKGCSGSSCSESATGIVSMTASGVSVKLDPRPDSVAVTAYRLPDTEFFTVEVVDDQPCRNWKEVDLPVQFRDIYAKAVAGWMQFHCGDSARASDWWTLTQSEFTSMIGATASGISGKAHLAGIYQMSSKRYINNCSCDCSFADNWKMSV